MRLMEAGWMKGSVIRTARKRHRCNYWMGTTNGGRCRHIIQPGEDYVEGDPNDDAGGYGNDRICMEHASVEYESAD